MAFGVNFAVKCRNNICDSFNWPRYSKHRVVYFHQQIISFHLICVLFRSAYKSFLSSWIYKEWLKLGVHYILIWWHTYDIETKGGLFMLSSLSKIELLKYLCDMVIYLFIYLRAIFRVGHTKSMIVLQKKNRIRDKINR